LRQQAEWLRRIACDALACYTAFTVTLRRFVIIGILAVCLGGQIAEMFDSWDRTLEDGNDTEAYVVVVALCVGVAFSFAGAIVTRLLAILRQSAAFVFSPILVAADAAASAVSVPIPTSSPPSIPLRV